MSYGSRPSISVIRSAGTPPRATSTITARLTNPHRNNPTTPGMPTRPRIRTSSFGGQLSTASDGSRTSWSKSSGARTTAICAIAPPVSLPTSVTGPGNRRANSTTRGVRLHRTVRVRPERHTPG